MAHRFSITASYCHGSPRSSSHNKRTFFALHVHSYVNLETRWGRPRQINLAPYYVRVYRCMYVLVCVPPFCFIGTLIKGGPKAELKNNASTYSARWCVTERPLYGCGDNWEISLITPKWYTRKCKWKLKATNTSKIILLLPKPKIKDTRLKLLHYCYKISTDVAILIKHVWYYNLL